MSELLTDEAIQGLSGGLKKDNRDIVIDYLTSDQGMVTLNQTQKELLDRWEHVDNLIRSNRYRRGDIEIMITKRFDVSIATARRDYANACYVFGSTMPSNKKYLLGVHADFIQNAMRMAVTAGDLKSAAALAREYTNAIEKMPDDAKGNQAAPLPVYVLDIANVNLIMSGDLSSAAMAAIAKQKLEKEGLTEDLSDEDYDIS